VREEINVKDKSSIKQLITDQMMSMARLKMTMNGFNKYRYKSCVYAVCCRNRKIDPKFGRIYQKGKKEIIKELDVVNLLRSIKIMKIMFSITMPVWY
jgi:hypothetical protein